MSVASEQRLDHEMRLLRATENVWVHAFHEALQSFIRRGDPPETAVKNARATADLVGGIMVERTELLQQAVSKLYGEAK